VTRNLNSLLGGSTVRQVSLLVAATLWAASAAADASTAKDAIDEAEADLKAVQEAGFEWRLVDPKATGKGSSVPISELLDIARKKVEEGDTDEAERIAREVSHAAQMGLEQAEAAKQAKPWYGSD
jgi:hypothetical protein